MTQVIFVMGAPGSGKSTFIKKNLSFKNFQVLDLFDFQNEFMNTAKKVAMSYIALKKKLLELINNDESVIVEHTLLKAKRRAYYLKALKRYRVPITGYFLDPSIEEFKKRKTGRDIDYFIACKKGQEIPQLQEGFDKLVIIAE